MSISHLKEKYQKEIVPQLQKELSLKNALSVPRVEKVIVNLGISEGAKDKGAIIKPAEDMALITGQKPKVAKARISVAGFRLREGSPIGLVTTLRGVRMYDFLEKLFKIALPRLRDFQGVLLKSFDGRGNYNLGITEWTVFPELEFSKNETVHGMQITIVTSAKNDKQAKRLLELLGMPFEKKDEQNK